MFKPPGSGHLSPGRLFFPGRRFLAQVFPGRCSVCGQVRKPDSDHEFLCSGCLNQLKPRTGGYCPVCARIYADQSFIHSCRKCRISPFSWTSISFYSIYEGLLKDLVLKYKFSGQLGLGRVLADFLCWSVRDVVGRLDCVVPVPLHGRRLRHRGFNQCLELSLIMAGRLNLPVHRQAVARIRHTPPQSTVGRDRRLRNLKGVFQARTDFLDGKRVLLVDDIMTTGATLEECTRTLLKANAGEVHVAFLARAV